MIIINKSFVDDLTRHRVHAYCLYAISTRILMPVRWPLVVSLLFHLRRSLYDNNIPTMLNGTFDSLRNIQTLYEKSDNICLFIQKGQLSRGFILIIYFSSHLGRNPFLCDCYLTWLADYLHRKPVETSGVRCESPRRMQRRRISVLRDEKSRCSGKSSPFPSRWLLIEMLNDFHLIAIGRSWLGA